MQRFGGMKSGRVSTTRAVTSRQIAYLVSAFVAGILVAVISVQNGQRVDVQFLWLSVQGVPLVVVIVASALVGVFCGALAILVRRTRL